MVTISDFKKRLRVGVSLHSIHHHERLGMDQNKNVLWGEKDMGIREVSIVQTNSFALKTTRTDGKVVDSWCMHPKASECGFSPTDPDTIVIYEKWAPNNIDPKILIPSLTYKFV